MAHCAETVDWKAGSHARRPTGKGAVNEAGRQGRQTCPNQRREQGQ